MELSLASIVLLFLTIPLILKLFMIIFKKPARINKNQAPSPPSLPVIGHLHLFKEPIHRTLQALAAKHRKLLLLRLGTRRALLALSDRPRMLNGEVFQYGNSTVSFLPYGHAWRNHRRFLTIELFSSVRLASFRSVREGEVGAWLDGIKKCCGDLGIGKIDLKPKFEELGFNAMTMIIMGKR